MTSLPALVNLTLLSSIPGPDFPVALERQRTIGLKYLDLKDGIWSKSVEQLSVEDSARAAGMIRDFDLQVHCFSTTIGHTPLELGMGEADFRARYEPALENALSAAAILRPQVIRLLAPRLSSYAGEWAVTRMAREFAWVMNVYRDWVDRITAAGFGVLIENEATGCLLGSVDDVLLFFEALDRPAARFTWDIQNLWQNGTFPTLDIYERLRPLIGAVHLKGGRSETANPETLACAAPLDEASWPVRDIVRAVVADGVAPYICLNPSHGVRPPGYDYWEVAQREVAWLRRAIAGIA